MSSSTRLFVGSSSSATLSLTDVSDASNSPQLHALIDSLHAKPAANDHVHARTHNFVATCEFGKPLPLRPLAIALSGSNDEAVFPSTFVRYQETNCTNSFFGLRGGNVSVGARSELEALLTQLKLSDDIHRTLGIDTTVLNYNNCNIVARVEFPYSVQRGGGGCNLDLLASDLTSKAFEKIVQQHPRYIPDKFRGLSVELEYEGVKMVMAMFHNGVGAMTGITNSSDVEKIDKLFRSLPSYETGNEYRRMTHTEQRQARARQIQIMHKKMQSPAVIARNNARKREAARAQQTRQIAASKTTPELERVKQSKKRKQIAEELFGSEDDDDKENQIPATDESEQAKRARFFH